jgi:hypothetical protein
MPDLFVIGTVIAEKMAEYFVILAWAPSCRQADD